MKKVLYLLMGLTFTMNLLGACSSEEISPIPPDHLEEEESPTETLLKQVYRLFGLNRDDFVEFYSFTGVSVNNQAITLSAIKKANSKLVFAVYDSIQSKTIVCDSTFIVPSLLQQTYYDETINYEPFGINSSFHRTKNGGVGLAQIHYKYVGKTTNRYFAYFLNGNKLTRLDSTRLGNSSITSILDWSHDYVMIQSYATNGYKNVLYDLDGNTISTFNDGVRYADYEHILYALSNFVQYKFESGGLTISRKSFEDKQSAKEKWSHYINYPQGFDSHKLKYTYSQDENLLTFHVSGIQENGSTEKFDLAVNIETGRYEIITE